MIEIIQYILIGMMWAKIWERIEWKYNNRNTTNGDIFVHILCWPFFVIVFIVGWFRGIFFDSDDE